MEDYSQRISRQKQYLLDSAHIRDAQIVWAVEQQRGKNQDQRWCCAACRAQITDETCLIPIEGQHEHHKVNPQGHAFQFRSFKYAEGCVPIGEPTAEHSWYSGYLWQFAHCTRCHSQLGWYFAGAESFFGLINQYLVRCTGQKAP